MCQDPILSDTGFRAQEVSLPTEFVQTSRETRISIKIPRAVTLGGTDLVSLSCDHHPTSCTRAPIRTFPPRNRITSNSFVSLPQTVAFPYSMKRVVNDLSTPINEPDFRQHRTLREKFQVKKKKENETKRRNIGLRNVSKHAGSSAHLRSILGPSSVTIPPLNPKIYNTQNPKTYSFLLQFQKISSRSLRNIR